jgi:hypothetical protein
MKFKKKNEPTLGRPQVIPYRALGALFIACTLLLWTLQILSCYRPSLWPFMVSNVHKTISPFLRMLRIVFYILFNQSNGIWNVVPSLEGPSSGQRLYSPKLRRVTNDSPRGPFHCFHTPLFDFSKIKLSLTFVMNLYGVQSVTKLSGELKCL